MRRVLPYTVVLFVVGVCLCQGQANLWPVAGPLWLCTALFLVLFLSRRRAFFCSAVLLALSLCAGFSYANWRAQWRLDDALAARLEGQDIVVRGRVVDLPQAAERGTRFIFEPESSPAGVPKRMSLMWYAQTSDLALPPIRAAQRWQLQVRLKRPHASQNAQGFDFEAWLFERNIRATGYVRVSPQNQLLGMRSGPAAMLDRWRERIRQRFEHALPDSPWRGVLVALAIGDQSGISAEQWRVFAATGITHLVAISGLHVSMIAALLAWLTGSLWRRQPALCLRWPAQKAMLCGGAIAAALYVALAGFGVPAQRTLYMLLVVALAPLLGRRVQALHSWLVALWLVVVIDPWAVLAAGFWLSFMAVGALMLCAHAIQHQAPGLRRPAGDGPDCERPTRKMAMAWAQAGLSWGGMFLRTQWALLWVSVPLLLALFGQFSLLSPLANAIAVPLVSLLVTPLALLFALLPLPSLAEMASFLFGALMLFLQWLASLPMAVWQQAVPARWLAALAVVAALWALLPRGVPARWVALLVFVPLLSLRPARPLPAEFRVTVIDVGQGLAVHVQTADHDLLFDSGPQFSPQADSGGRIIAPYLRAHAVGRLDAMILSHDDIDHTGGALSVIEALPVAQLMGSLPPGHAALARGLPWRQCLTGLRWHWDGVSFEFLHPTAQFRTAKDNNRSCVLRIRSAHGAALLAGDIEVLAEHALMQHSPAQLRADVLLAPHHGSRSSSSAEFIAAVAPRVVVFTSGYRNRFGHPHPLVVARYRHAGVNMRRSDYDGAVSFGFGRAGMQVSTQRELGRRYWHQKFERD